MNDSMINNPSAIATVEASTKHKGNSQLDRVRSNNSNSRLLPNKSRFLLFTSIHVNNHSFTARRLITIDSTSNNHSWVKMIGNIESHLSNVQQVPLDLVHQPEPFASSS